MTYFQLGRIFQSLFAMFDLFENFRRDVLRCSVPMKTFHCIGFLLCGMSD